MEEELKKQALESGADKETTDGADKETTDLDRRRFFGGLATVIGTAAVIGLAGERGPTEAKEIKSKILSRIQQQLNQEQGEEGMEYTKSTHDRYGKGPAPVEPPVS